MFICKSCHVEADTSIKSHQHQKQCPICYRESIKAHRVKNVAVTMFNAAKRRAKIKGIDFSISVKDIVIPSHCPVLGTPLTPGVTHTDHDNSPSLDRLDNTKGYIDSNVNVISYRANSIKNLATLDELRKILQWMKDTAAIAKND